MHHGLARLVGHVAAPDVVIVPPVLAGAERQPPEEQRGVRIVGQFGDAAGQGAAEGLRGVRVAGHRVTGGEQMLGALPHPGQGGAGVGQVLAFRGQQVIRYGQGHGRRSQA
jgi:hypothetical protein